RQVALSFLNVMRQQVDQQFRDAVDKLPGLGKRADVLRYLRMAPGEWPEFRDKVGIRQKADVEHQVGFLGNAMPVAEADAGDEDAFVRTLPMKALHDVLPQLVDVEFCGIDHHV